MSQAKSTLGKSSQTRNLKSETLVSVKPGSYMMLHTNKMKRLMKESQGLLVGKRVLQDNHAVVLVDEDLILVPED